MKVKVSKRFVKDTKNINDKRILNKIRETLVKAESVIDISSLENLSELSGFPGFYRIRFDYRYRIGLYYDGDTIEFLRVGRREDFYKKFP